jgi:hypothetical protein
VPGAGALSAGAAPSPPARKAQSRTSRPPVQGHHLHCCTWCRRGCDRHRLESAPSGRLPQRLAAQLQRIAILCRQHLVATHTRRARAREERGVDVHHGVPSSVRELAAPRAALPDSRCVLLERVLRGEIKVRNSVNYHSFLSRTVSADAYVEGLNALGAARLERLADNGEVRLVVTLSLCTHRLLE